MQSLQSFPVTMTKMAHVLWRQRWTFVWAGVASVVIYHVLVLLFLSNGFTEPPTYVKVYNVPQNLVTIWRATPSLLDVINLVDNEAVFEFGRTTSLFKAGKAVTWNYVATIHVLGDTGLIFLILAVYVTLLRALREQAQRQISASCPGLGRAVLSASVLSLIGAGTGAACCGAISVSLVVTILGATATVAARLARYQLLVIVLGYLLLGGSLVHQWYRLYQLLRQHPGAAVRDTSLRRAAESTVAISG